MSKSNRTQVLAVSGPMYARARYASGKPDIEWLLHLSCGHSSYYHSSYRPDGRTSNEVRVRPHSIERLAPPPSTRVECKVCDDIASKAKRVEAESKRRDALLERRRTLDETDGAYEGDFRYRFEAEDWCVENMDNRTWRTPHRRWMAQRIYARACTNTEGRITAWLRATGRVHLAEQIEAGEHLEEQHWMKRKRAGVLAS